MLPISQYVAPLYISVSYVIHKWDPGVFCSQSYFSIDIVQQKQYQYKYSIFLWLLSEFYDNFLPALYWEFLCRCKLTVNMKYVAVKQTKTYAHPINISCIKCFKILLNTVLERVNTIQTLTKIYWHSFFRLCLVMNIYVQLKKSWYIYNSL